MGAPSAVAERTGRGAHPGGRPSAGRGRLPRLELGLLVTALIAFVCAALVPLAPVSVSTPTVSWPQDPAAPVSTELQLTAQRPAALDVRFSCAALTAARDAGDGVLLSTVVPGRLAEVEGLQVRLAADDTVSVVSNGTEVYRGGLAGGDCAYRLQMDPDATRLMVDGRPLAETGGALPDVDLLATSVTALPGGTADDLGVTVDVDDQFSTSPTPLKWAIAAVLLLASLACLALLALRERRARATAGSTARARSRWWRAVSVVDLAVAAVLLLWLFIAPHTDDDGYYSAMARNAVENGYVGNYFQLLNQGYPPFSWFYQLLGYWDLLGSSPVVLRIPSLVAGLVTYGAARAIVESVGIAPARTTAGRLVRHGVVALVFLTAWLPYSMGVRPESISAVFAVLTLGAVVVARRRGSLAWYAAALLVAGIGVTCHPTGIVALAPWLLSIPAMWPLVRSTGPWRTLAVAAGVVAPAALAAVPGFLDGSLRDFTYSQEIYARLWPQESWYREWLRWSFLLGDGPMGSYAKRATVLVAMVAFLWFAVLQLAAGGRARRAFPPLVALTGWSFGLSLLLLWLTPSKWTHHFGALAGMTTVFVACALLQGARTVVAAQRGRRSLAPATVLAALSLVLVFALAMHGPNSWAYSWLLGMPHRLVPPFAGPVAFDRPAVWLVVVAAVGVLVWWRLPRRRRSWGRVTALAFPAAVLVFLAVTLAYLVGSFSLATVRTWDTYSPQADALQDPLAREGGAQHAIRAADPRTATVLPLQEGSAATVAGFSEQGGYLPSAPPTDTADDEPTVWGSYPGPGAEANTGELTTGWYALPDAAPDLRLLVEASGRPGGGNSLVAEYGELTGDGGVAALGSQVLDDGADSPFWRQLTLVPSPGAEVVRLVAADRTDGPGGWLALTAPVEAQMRPLTEVVGDGDVTAVAWQLAFQFPAAELPVTVHGITEPVDWVFAWGEGPLGGLGDAAFTRERAGLWHPTVRSSTLTQLATDVPGQPDLRTFTAYQVRNPYADAAYDLERGRTVVWGWQAP
ncbi:arabinosyltransferase domain-containing protein [Geodermatophilus sp. SYSU D00766]